MDLLCSEIYGPIKKNPITSEKFGKPFERYWDFLGF